MMVSSARTKRLLVTSSPANAPALLAFIKDLTGSAPAPVSSPTTPPTPSDSDGNGHADPALTDLDSISGVMHPWTLETKYYSAELTIWLDQFHNPAEWAADFLSDEAADVIEALGAWVYCFRKPATQEEFDLIKGSLQEFSAVAAKIEDGCCLAVALPQAIVPYQSIDSKEWEDLCFEHGFEFVDSEAGGKNAFGERLGMSRVREALESNDWSFSDNTAGSGESREQHDAEQAVQDSSSLTTITRLLAENDEHLFPDSSFSVDSLKGLCRASNQQPDGDGADFKHTPPGENSDDSTEKRQVDELEAMIHKVLALREANGGSSEFAKADMAELQAMMERILFEEQSGRSGH